MYLKYKEFTSNTTFGCNKTAFKDEIVYCVLLYNTLSNIVMSRGIEQYQERPIQIIDYLVAGSHHSGNTNAEYKDLTKVDIPIKRIPELSIKMWFGGKSDTKLNLVCHFSQNNT